MYGYCFRLYVNVGISIGDGIDVDDGIGVDGLNTNGIPTNPPAPF